MWVICRGTAHLPLRRCKGAVPLLFLHAGMKPAVRLKGHDRQIAG
jgi:hypothetical protein